MNKLLVGALLCALTVAGCTCGEGTSPITGGGSLRPSVSVQRTEGVVADGVDVATVIVTVLNKDGQPVPGLPVSLAASGANNTLQAPGTTDSQGVARGSIASTRAEVKTLTVTIDANGTPVEVADKPTVRFVHGPAARLAFSVPPGATQAGASITPAVQVSLQDAHGNVASTGTQEVTLSLGANAQGATLSGSKVATTTAGVASFPNLQIAKAGTGYTLTASVQGLGPVTSTPFDITVGPPSRLAFITQPTHALAGVALAPAVRIELQDSQGNLATTATSQVTLALSNPDGAILSGTATVAAVGGVVEFADLSIDKAAVGYTLAASATGYQGAVSDAFTITHNTPDSARTQLTATPASAVADGAEQVALKLVVKDAYGNAVPQQAVSLTVSGTGNTLDAATGATDATGAFSATLASTKAEKKTVTAQAGTATASTEVGFTSGAVSRNDSTFEATPASAVADGVTPITLRVTLRDVHGNPVPAQDVELDVDTCCTVLTPTSGTTDASGVFSATLVSTVAEASTVTATSGGISLTADVTFTPGAPDEAQSTFTVEPARVVANGSATTALVLHLYDAQGNAVPFQEVTFSVSGSGNTLERPTGQTNLGGVFSSFLSSTKAEVKTVTVTYGQVTRTATVTFEAGAPDSTTSTLVATPARLVADGVAVSALAVSFKDAQGNPTPNQPVSLTVTGTGNTLSALSGSTDENGLFTATLASTVAEEKTVTATSGDASAEARVTFEPGAPASATSSFSASPAVLVAHGAESSTLTLLVKDAQGNPVANQAVTLSASGSDNTLTPASGTTDATGVFVATLASTRAEVKTVTATFGSASLTATVTFVPGEPVTAMSSLSVSPASVVADGSATSNVTLTLKDAHGNAVPNQAVTFSATGTGNTLTPASGSTDASGVFTATLASTKAEAKTVTATFGALSLTATVTFVSGAPAMATSTLVASPTSLVANGSATSALTLTLKDAQGNAVANQAVTLSASGTGNTLTPASGSTDASGVLTATLASTKAEAKTVTATFGALSLTATVTFVPGAAATATSTLVASPTSLVANGSATSTLTFTVKDAQGNAVPNQAVTFSASGTGNTLTPANGSTDANGVFTATLASTKAESKTVTATAGAATLTATVTFVPGAPVTAMSSFSANPTSLVANGSATTTLTLTLKDAQGNAVANQAVTLASSGTGNTFSPASGSTNASGVFTATLASTKAETKTVTATFGALSLTAFITFEPGAAATATSTLVASPTSLVANGSATSTLTFTVRDAQGNPVANQAVTLSASGTGNTLTPANGSTNASGVFTATLASTRAEAKTVTATAGAATLTATVTFVPGAAATATSTLVASPTSLVANGSATSTLTFTVRDAQGNPVANQAVALSATGTSNTLTPASGSTNASGVFTATLASTKAEAKTVTATAGAATLTTTVTFVPGAAATATSTLVASPASLVANGSATSALTFTVRDAQGNAVPNQAVTFSASGTGNTLTPASGSTNASGVFTATLASTRAETKTVTANAGAATLTATVTFVPGAPAAATSTLVASPSSVIQGGTTTLTVTVRDANNNPVPGVAVALSSSGSNNTFTPNPANGTTNASGVYSATLSSTAQEVKTVTALVGNGAFALMTNVTFGCTALVLGDDQTTGTQDLANALTAAGVTTTVVANGGINYSGTPAASGFNAVVVLVGNNYSTDMPAAGQSNLVNANTAGTGVVLTEWAAYHAENGRWTTLRSLQLLQRSSGTEGRLTFTLESAGHPIWSGLPNSFTTVHMMGANVGNTLLNGGVRIAGCTECSSTGVVVKDATGRIVQLAHAGNYNVGGASNAPATWTTDPNTTRMMVNAVKWAGRCQ